MIRELEINSHFNEKENDLSFNSEDSNSSIEVDIEEINESEFQKPIYKIAQSISNILEKYINISKNINMKISKEFSLFEVFYNYEIPEISIYKYLQRIILYTNIEENTLVSSLIYIDRLCIKNIPVNIYTIHKLLFSCILIALKVNEDCFYKNNYYSEISGIPLKELNQLEYNLLILLDFQTNISLKVFNEYKNGLLMNMTS
jgi:hypothetical protein